MTWEDEALKPDTRPIAAAKIGDVRKFADVYLEDDPDDPGPWLERLITAKGPSREVNLQTHEVVSPEAELELADGDGEISDLLVETQIQGQETGLFSKLRTLRNEVVSKKVFQGPLERREGIGGDTLSCVIRPNRLEKLGIVQTPVSLDRFPSAPANEVGNGCPIVIGYMNTTDTNWTKGVLPVRAPVVADTGQGGGICLHTGPGGSNAATHVIRDRNGVITDLGISGGGNWTVNPVAVDAQGRRYIAGAIVAGQFANADQFYTDEMQGIQKEGYVTLDGAADYYRRLNADLSSDFPGKGAVTSYTFEVKFRTGAAVASKTLYAKWNGTTGQYSILLYTDGAGVLGAYHRTAAGGTVARVTAGALAINTEYTARVSWEAGESFTLQVAGATYSAGTIPADIATSTADFVVGAFSQLTNKWNGRIYYLLWAEGAQPLTGANTHDRQQPLEDIKGEWRFYSAYGDDYQGDNDLTPVGLVPGDYTHTSIETTPAWIIDRILRWKPYLNIPCNLVNRTSFGALAAEQEADSWHTAEYYAGAIPWTDNSPYIKDTGFVLSELLKNQDAVLFENDFGRFTIKSADISETIDEVTANLTVEDITIEDVTHTRRPLELLNDCRYPFRINNMGAGELWTSAADEASQEAYSLITKDAKIELPFIRHQTMAEGVIKRQMLRRAGDAYKIKFTLADIWGAGLNPGDIITLTHPNMPGGWDRKQFYITGVNPDLISGTVDIIAVSVADVYGPISFLYSAGGGAPPVEDETDILSPTLDTQVSKYSPNTAYGAGAYFVIDGWDYNYVTRLALKFAVSTLGATTIKSATLKLYCTASRQISGSPDPLKLRQLLITTWGNNSTWNHFAADGAGAAWTDGTCIGAAAFAPDVSPYGTGWKTFTLNAAGIAYLQAQIAGNAHFTLLGLENEDWNQFASQEHGTTSWRPTLTVVWV